MLLEERIFPSVDSCQTAQKNEIKLITARFDPRLPEIQAIQPKLEIAEPEIPDSADPAPEG